MTDTADIIWNVTFLYEFHVSSSIELEVFTGSFNIFPYKFKWFLLHRQTEDLIISMTTFQQYILLFRSNHSQVFCRTAILRKFPEFTGKHLPWSPIFISVAGIVLCNFTKKGLHSVIFLQWVWRIFSEQLLYEFFHEQFSGGKDRNKLISFRYLAFCKPISGQWYIYTETSQLICTANQLICFYMSVKLAWCKLILNVFWYSVSVVYPNWVVYLICIQDPMELFAKIDDGFWPLTIFAKNSWIKNSCWKKLFCHNFFRKILNLFNYYTPWHIHYVNFEAIFVLHSKSLTCH